MNFHFQYEYVIFSFYILRKIAKMNYCYRHICLSVCLLSAQYNYFYTGGIFMQFNI